MPLSIFGNLICVLDMSGIESNFPPRPSVHAPWGYEYLPSEKEVYGIWVGQIIISISLYIGIPGVGYVRESDSLLIILSRGGYMWESVSELLHNSEMNLAADVIAT